jgi:signal transduction histidine kinase
MKSPLSILYLENDPRDAELVQEMLASHGIECLVTRVETESDYIASLKQGGFDLILADYTLPSLDGLSALKIARQDWSQVPLIFVSGTLSEDVAIEALKIGATDYVFKTRLSRIVPAVQRALREAEEAAIARERELFAQQRANELAKANEALRGCLDALALVPELDEFLGQVMAAITRQLGAVSSTLWMCNYEQNTLTLELLYQDGRVMSPAEAKYPDDWRNLSLDKQRAATFSGRPPAIIDVLHPHSPMPEDQRSYLRELGVKTLLIIPLASRGQADGRLTFRFTEERDFHPEELEIGRALATQASLAIHLTRSAKAARQSAVLEERNQLAAEIHDALAQSFTGISMQLGVATEQLAAQQGDPLNQIQRANEIAKFGLAQARRSILSLHSSAIDESGLTTRLQRLVDNSNVAGLLRCDFRCDYMPDESLPPRIQHELLRFAQEAISNAVRHARPTVVTVTLCREPPNLILKVKDNGSGISRASLEKSDGFGLHNMRTRAAQIGGKLDIYTSAGHGTSIVLTVPIPS